MKISSPKAINWTLKQYGNTSRFGQKKAKKWPPKTN
jgi:hypothetical protein